MSNKKMTNKIRNIIIAASLAVGAAAIGLGIYFLWKPEPEGIVIAVSNLPDSLNPVLAQNVSGLNADELVYDGLVNFEVDPDSGELYPELALAEAIEQDPATKQDYTVLLRQVSPPKTSRTPSPPTPTRKTIRRSASTCCPTSGASRPWTSIP